MRTLFAAALLAWAAVSPAQQEDRAALLERSYAELQAARAALQQAKAARESGIEPLPGERLGVVSGAGERRTRLSDEYRERQQRLERDVEQARERVDAAQTRWNELR